MIDPNLFPRGTLSRANQKALISAISGDSYSDFVAARYVLNDLGKWALPLEKVILEAISKKGSLGRELFIEWLAPLDIWNASFSSAIAECLSDPNLFVRAGAIAVLARRGNKALLDVAAYIVPDLSSMSEGEIGYGISDFWNVRNRDGKSSREVSFKDTLTSELVFTRQLRGLYIGVLVLSKLPLAEVEEAVAGEDSLIFEWLRHRHRFN